MLSEPDFLQSLLELNQLLGPRECDYLQRYLQEYSHDLLNRVSRLGGVRALSVSAPVLSL